MNDNEGLSIETLENAVVKFETPPMRKWRCTRGHTWKSPYEACAFVFGNSLLDQGIEEAKFCAKCCYDWMREYCGKVREVK